MKKFGFTLVEILLVLGIVGSIAAITLPVLNKTLPDKDKIAVLKTYKVITDITEDILNDKKWIPLGRTGEQRSLARLSAKVNNVTKEIEPNDTPVFVGSPEAFGLIFASLIHTKETPVYAKNDSESTAFTSLDGHNWTISVVHTNSQANPNGYIITVDFMNQKENRCTYSQTCTNPGQFSFWVSDSGIVWGNDPLTNAYIANPDKLNDKDKDFQTAKSDSTKYKTATKKES